MVTFKQCLDAFSFVFFLTSPLTSYGDQILSMHRRKSSAGFSIDVCGIMLVARYFRSFALLLGLPKFPGEYRADDVSILRVFFWFGDQYELSLLGQSLLMIAVQVPIPSCVDVSNKQCVLLKMCLDHRPNTPINSKRPSNIWAWQNPGTYWDVLLLTHVVNLSSSQSSSLS